MDIVISEHNFKKQWNLRSQKNLWIIDKDSIEQIGCIHTCQGLEVDYIGVIIGPDLRFENGRVITDITRRSGNDKSVNGFKSRFKSDPVLAAREADEIIKKHLPDSHDQRHEGVLCILLRQSFGRAFCLVNGYR